MGFITDIRRYHANMHKIKLTPATSIYLDLQIWRKLSLDKIWWFFHVFFLVQKRAVFKHLQH